MHHVKEYIIPDTNVKIIIIIIFTLYHKFITLVVLH